MNTLIRKMYNIKIRNSMRVINQIVVHCSATREHVDYSPEQLERDHKARGFICAGYNFYIRKSGEIVKLRAIEQIPAHVKGYNEHSMGICYEGGLDIFGRAHDTRTNAQKASLLQLLRHLMIRFPGSRIYGHRDLSADLNGDGVITPDEWVKQCPSFDARDEYGYLEYE